MDCRRRITLAVVAMLMLTVAAPLLSFGSAATAPSVEPLSSSWRHWAACWGDGYWARLSEAAAEERRRLGYSHAVPPPNAMDNFTWVVRDSNACAGAAWRAFDRADFCAVLDGRPIFIVGDSLSRRLADSLELLASPQRLGSKVGGGFVFPYRTSRWNTSICNDHKPSAVLTLLNWLGGHIQLAESLRHRTVSSACAIEANGARLAPPAPRACRAINVVTGSAEDKVWGVDEFVEPLEGAIVILNEGMHVDATHRLLRRARAALEALSASLPPSATIIWRNTSPGHANCSRHTAPLTEPQRGPLPHRWDEIAAQNARVEALVATLPRAILWDVATPTALRADMHTSAMETPPHDGDCAHYVARAPSPVDSWVVSLYNLLRADARRSIVGSATAGTQGAGSWRLPLQRVRPVQENAVRPQRHR